MSVSQPLVPKAAWLGAGWPWRLAVLLACAIGAHALLSPLGFNPTDDGFILAQSRRILSGEVPHRDFITIRPAGSVFLHTVDLLGGDHTFLFSRLLYWLEVAVSCWVWLEIAIARFGLSRANLFAVPLGVLAFMLSTHAFPPMAWHTVDGVLLGSVGFFLSGSSRRGVGALGYLAIGLAAICKQNFLPLVPVAILVHGDVRRPMPWIAGLLPIVTYVTWIGAAGGWRDLWVQVGAQTDLAESGFWPYLRSPWFGIGVAIGAIAGTSWGRRGTPMHGRLALPALILVWAVVGFAGMRIDAPDFEFIGRDSLVLLGLAAGVTVSGRRIVPPGAGVFLVALAWCSGISKGYQSAAHVAGPLASVAILSVVARTREGSPGIVRWTMACALLGLGIVTPHWWSARHDHILHESTAPLLTQDLGGIFPGARGVRTNVTTKAVLVDLRDAVASAPQRPYAILVDGAAWWACAPQRNPLPADWPQSIELPTLELQGRFSRAIVDRRGKLSLILQKAHIGSLGDRLVSIDERNEYFGAATWTRHTCELVAERRFWSIYQ